tara:strand:- start:3344 stop:3637 length:294 start_codon:yes stop_codon:yes gene_type:complete
MSEVLYKNVDGVRTKLTDAEIEQRKKDEQQALDDAPKYKLMEIRSEREPLLLEADHKINTLLDNGGDATAWRKYRQELRDITKASDLDKVTFPSKPS